MKSHKKKNEMLIDAMIRRNRARKICSFVWEVAGEGLGRMIGLGSGGKNFSVLC